MKKYIFFFLLCFVSTVAISQVSVSYSVGYGTDNMGDMRDYLKHKLQIIKPLTSNATITDDFARPLSHTVEVSYTYQKEEFGVQITVMNTTGRITYNQLLFRQSSEEKYSMKGLRLGTMYRRPIIELPVGKKQLTIFGEVSPGVMISSMKYSGSFMLKNGIDNSEDGVGKVSISLLPFVGARFNIIKDLGLQAAAGYDLNLGGKIDDVYESRVDWSGLRVKGGVYYTF